MDGIDEEVRVERQVAREVDEGQVVHSCVLGQQPVLELRNRSTSR